jgi:hypothetical protein
MSWIIGVPVEVAHAMLTRFDGQLSFDQFILRVIDQRLLDVYVRIDDDDTVRLGLSVPVGNGEDWLLFDITGNDAGIDPQWLLTAATLRLHDEIDSLIGETP